MRLMVRRDKSVATSVKQVVKDFYIMEVMFYARST